jgi:hypothetical protein
MGAKYERRRRRRRIVVVALIAAVVSLIAYATAPTAPKEPDRYPCDALFAEHDARAPDQTANDPLDALLDTNLLLSCFGVLKNWRTATLPLMRLSIQHEGGEDVQDVDGAQPLKYALRSADAAIRQMPPQGLVVVTSASQAWPLIAALRARDDIDVASSRRNVDAALVVRRRNSHPPSLERLDLRTLTKLEWPPTPEVLETLKLPADAFPRPLEPSELLRWLSPTMTEPFSPDKARAARDAAHWRASCYSSLKSDGALAAKPCFQAHERHQRLWHTPSSYDSVPLGLVAMAHGDVSGAVAALSAAYKTDPKATQQLLERAAAAIAPT